MHTLVREVGIIILLNIYYSIKGGFWKIGKLDI